MSDKPTPFQGGSNLDQLMPVVLFIVFFNLVNTETAVIAATAWSIKAAVSRYRRGLPIGVWLPGITVYFMLRAGITIAVERDIVDFGVSSEAVFFGISIGTKILVGLVIAVTIIIGRPFLVWGIPKVVKLPEAVSSDPRYFTTLRNATWLIVVYELGSSIWDIWLFNHAGVNLFLVTRQVVNFIVAFVFITAALTYIDRRLDAIEEYPGLLEVLEQSGRVKSQSNS